MRDRVPPIVCQAHSFGFFVGAICEAHLVSLMFTFLGRFWFLRPAYTSSKQRSIQNRVENGIKIGQSGGTRQMSLRIQLEISSFF